MKELYITTPIYYVNDIPHIGHAYTSIISDTIARFFKLYNYDVKFLTGTDEHGLKVEKAARKNNSNPQEYVDMISKNFLNLSEILNLSNDDFIRTTELRHKESVKFFWEKLVKNNQVYLDKYEGWYSIKDETFYQEKELMKKNGSFETIDGEKVEWVKEESYFFKLSQWQNKLLELYETNENFILPKSRKNEVVSFVKNGLKDLSISRTSFSWGIKVPDTDNHVIYVWIDALANYITSLDYPNINKHGLSLWKNSIHIIGKDILKFHAVYWPALLMGANLDPPKQIFAHGWWTNEGKKISKSLGNTIDPLEIVKKFGLDQIRYFLLREITLGQDGDFSEKALISRINADLSNNLGNLIQRTLKLNDKYFENKFPFDLNENQEFKVLEYGYKLLGEVESNMRLFQINKALENIWNFISKLNQYIDKTEPWKLFKENKDETAIVLSEIIESIRLLGIILQPFIPDSSSKILDTLNIDKKHRGFDSFNKHNIIKKGTKLNEVKQLFPRYNV